MAAGQAPCTLRELVSYSQLQAPYGERKSRSCDHRPALKRRHRRACHWQRQSGSELQHASPNYLPYVNNRIVSHDVQVVMQIYRWIAVGRYECDNAAKRQAISRSWKGETTVLISEKRIGCSHWRPIAHT